MAQQPEFKLQWVDKLGSLTATYKEGVTKAGNPSRTFKKLSGTGDKWLYAQMLTGDIVDNIPGLPKMGGAKAYKLLDPCQSEEELAWTVKQAYQEVYGDMWEVEMYEQAHLVYMVRELDDNNQLVFWRMPDGD
jgi:5'-3' exonuclease